jgi:hypothetical protein
VVHSVVSNELGAPVRNEEVGSGRGSNQQRSAVSPRHAQGTRAAG